MRPPALAKAEEAETQETEETEEAEEAEDLQVVELEDGLDVFVHRNAEAWVGDRTPAPAVLL